MHLPRRLRSALARDIVSRACAAGFARAWIEPAQASGVPWGYGYAVIRAQC
ncbi:MAG TPA: hypothetical protein VHQ21_10485 [Rhodanobacteraceae bacterium]|jgi:hypothetical protein|nr:hypothetical protein [Rhodanobacteraceae bacterium]